MVENRIFIYFIWKFAFDFWGLGVLVKKVFKCVRVNLFKIGISEVILFI